MKNNSKVFVISDTHFGQWFANWFFNRPFDNVKDMDKNIIKNWNSVVGDDDIIIIVGDFYGGSRLFLRKLINSLKGEKILIKGNHDFKFRYRKLIEEKQIEVYDRLELMYKGTKLLFTHIAEDVDDETINIHGHYHRKLYPRNIIGKHFNVCVDHNDYKPVLLETILAFNFKVEENNINALELLQVVKRRKVWSSGFLLTL